MFNTKRAMWALMGMAAGAAFAAALVWPTRGRRPVRTDDQSSRVDEASEDSFPASDPPSFSVESGAQTAPGSRV